MAAERGSKGSGLEWFVRRGAAVRGPFSSAKVRHFVLEGKLDVNDEVSADRKTWASLGSVAEVVPLQMRANDDELEDRRAGQRRIDRMRALRTIIVSVLLLGALIGGIMLVGEGGESSERDCTVAPVANVLLDGCDLSQVMLEGVSMPGAHLANTKLQGGKLSTADLQGADMRYADLSGADLSYSRMGSVVLLGATLRMADLTNADLRGANLGFADLTGARLGGAQLGNADFEGAIWVDGSRCGASDCPR